MEIMIIDVQQDDDTGQVSLIVTSDALPAAVLHPETFPWTLTVDESLNFCTITASTHPIEDPPQRVMRFADVRPNVADGRAWALALIDSGPVAVKVVDSAGVTFRFETIPVVGTRISGGGKDC